MDNLEDIIAYYCLNYPHPSELSDARLTKMVYLSDWFACLALGRQLTNITWYFNHYGPYVDNILVAVNSNDIFSVTQDYTYYGNTKKTIQFVGDARNILLSQEAKIILDMTIQKTQYMYFNDFINFVYSTYPIAKNDRYAYLDLVSLAIEYRGIN